MRTRGAPSICPLLALIALAPVQGADAQIDIRRVVLSGEQVEGFPAGRTYGRASNFMFNRSGKVLFQSGVNGGFPPPFSGSGLWIDDHGTRTPVVFGNETITGDPALNGYRFSNFLPIGFNDSDQVAMRARLLVPGMSGQQIESIWRADPGQKRVVAYRDLPATGLPDTTFGSFFPPRAYNEVFSNTGKIGFWSTLNFDGLTQLNNESLWSGAPGDLQTVVREGFSIPGSPPTLLLGDNNPSQALLPKILMNSSGTIAFAGPTRPAGAGVWTGTPGQDYTRVTNIAVNSFSLNDAGHIAYDGGVAGGGAIEEVRLFAGGVTQVLARGGQPAPVGQPGVLYSRLSNTVIGGDDRVLFRGTLQGDGIDQHNDSALFMHGPDGSFRVVVREGQPAVGTTGVFDDVGQYALNSIGMVAFVSSRQSVPGDGVWVADIDNQLHLIAVEGDEFEVGPGDVRTILDVLLPSSLLSTDRQGYSTGGQEGLPMVLSDDGRVLFQLRFTDQSSGIFMATIPIPAPGSSVACVLAGALFARRRRR